MRRYDHLCIEAPVTGTQVVRFICPDLRSQLDDAAAIDSCTLFRELLEGALSDLGCGQTLVLNLGLVEPFPSAFLRFLLRVRERVQACQGRLILCRLTAEHREVFEITKTLRLFTLTDTEAEALYRAGVRRDFSA